MQYSDFESDADNFKFRLHYHAHLRSNKVKFYLQITNKIT